MAVTVDWDSPWKHFWQSLASCTSCSAPGTQTRCRFPVALCCVDRTAALTQFQIVQHWRSSQTSANCFSLNSGIQGFFGQNPTCSAHAVFFLHQNTIFRVGRCSKWPRKQVVMQCLSGICICAKHCNLQEQPSAELSPEFSNWLSGNKPAMNNTPRY